MVSTTVNREPESVLKIMRSIGPISMSKFNDRLYMQKLAYLVQEIQANEAHVFSWYVRGPYSPTMTEQLFYHWERGTYDRAPRLDDSEASVRDKVHELLGDKIRDPLALELFASLWYLMPAAKISKEVHDNIIKTMCMEKPHFSRSQIQEALAKIIALRKKYSI